MFTLRERERERIKKQRQNYRSFQKLTKKNKQTNKQTKQQQKTNKQTNKQNTTKQKQKDIFQLNTYLSRSSNVWSMFFQPLCSVKMYHILIPVGNNLPSSVISTRRCSILPEWTIQTIYHIRDQDNMTGPVITKWP